MTPDTETGKPRGRELVLVGGAGGRQRVDRIEVRQEWCLFSAVGRESGRAAPWASRRARRAVLGRAVRCCGGGHHQPERRPWVRQQSTGRGATHRGFAVQRPAYPAQPRPDPAPHRHGSSDLMLFAVEGEGVLETESGPVAFGAGSLAFYRGDEELRVQRRSDRSHPARLSRPAIPAPLRGVSSDGDLRRAIA